MFSFQLYKPDNINLKIIDMKEQVRAIVLNLLCQPVFQALPFSISKTTKNSLQSGISIFGLKAGHYFRTQKITVQ